MKITYYGHACFLIDTGKEKLLTDPFISGNPGSGIKADEVEADFILVSHGHSDHVGDTSAIAKRTGAKIISTIDTFEYIFASEGLIPIPGNIGGTVQAGSALVKFVSAIHGSGVPGGLACGFLISAEGKKVYFAGDTSLTMDMALLKDEKLDVALLPIGGVFTMDPIDAEKAVDMLLPALTIPMHFNTFPLIVQDASAFTASVKASGHDALVLNAGECVEI